MFALFIGSPDVGGGWPTTWTVQLARCGLSTMADSGLDGSSGRIEHLFDMVATGSPRLVHRTATVRLRSTRRQANRCYGLLRSAGDVWAWLLAPTGNGSDEASPRSATIRHSAES